jgi:tRNA dimethylallyltransferase
MAPVIAIVGPTAVGKSDLGVAVAHHLGGEVINADSMQLYAGMDIGTAKLTPAERQGIPHHLLDIWHPRHPADVATYQQLARTQIDALLTAGRPAVLVGGSGLYIRAALDEMEFPGTDPGLRAELEADLAQLGPAALHDRLAAIDPDAAAAILPGNGRRLVRALEVVALTGRFQARLPPPKSVYDVLYVGIDRPDLDARIAERTERMWDAGFVDEVRRLAGDGLREGRTASRALGYAQILAWLDGELSSEEAAKEATVRATCRFVRRQRSWFRRDRRIEWLSLADCEGLQSVTKVRSAQVAAVERLIAAGEHR